MSLWLGDVSLDVPLSRLSSGTLSRRLALPRAPQVHQLLCQGVRLHAAALHTVPSGLCPLQDPTPARQDQMLQIHLEGPKEARTLLINGRFYLTRVNQKEHKSIFYFSLYVRSTHQQPLLVSRAPLSTVMRKEVDKRQRHFNGFQTECFRTDRMVKDMNKSFLSYCTLLFFNPFYVYIYL